MPQRNRRQKFPLFNAVITELEFFYLETNSLLEGEEYHLGLRKAQNTEGEVEASSYLSGGGEAYTTKDKQFAP